MVFRPTPSGGWVFAASSIAFNGSVPTDPATAKILANILKMASSPRPSAPARSPQTSPAPAGRTSAPLYVPADGP